jgi:hypothetical protein
LRLLVSTDAVRQSGSEAVIADALNRAATVAAVPAPSRASIMPVMTSLGAADEQRPAFHLPRTDDHPIERSDFDRLPVVNAIDLYNCHVAQNGF